MPDRSRPLTALCWLAAAVVALWTVIRWFGLDGGFPLVPLLAFTPYVAVLALLGAGCALLLRRRLPGAIMAICGVLLVVLVLPRALPDDPPDPRPTGPGLRVAAANILLGEADLGVLADRIGDGTVDVLSVAELTPEADAAITESEIGELLPHAVADPEIGSSGTGLYSRYPLTRLPASGIEGNDLPTIIASVELPGGQTAEIFSIHPSPPTGSLQVERLAEYLDKIPPADPEGPPRLLIGDFNATLDNSALRDVLDRGYADAADATGSGLTWTWPNGILPPPVTIDHVIVDERVEVVDFEVEGLPGSDHRIVSSLLRLPAPTD